MRYSFMDVAMPLLLLSLLLGLCFLLGLLPCMAFSSGAGTMLVIAFVVAALSAGFTGWMAFMMADMEFDNPMRVAWIVGAIAFVVALAPPVSLATQGSSLAAYNREMAPKAQPVVLSLFDRIDVTRDGTLTDSELETAAANRDFTDDERAYIAYVRDQQATAGHVIDSYTTTTYIWISTGSNGSGYMSPVTTTTYIYGVTKADLAGFVARINATYKEW